MTHEGRMPSWPDINTFLGAGRPTSQHHDCWLYERARADAAMARLHYAVRQFEQAVLTFKQAGFLVAAGAMRDVIRDIGPLPPLPPLPEQRE